MNFHGEPLDFPTPQSLWEASQLDSSTRVWREGWGQWQYLEDALYEGGLLVGAPPSHAHEHLLEALLPSDSMLETILGKLDSPFSLETRAAARLLLIKCRDHGHVEVRTRTQHLNNTIAVMIIPASPVVCSGVRIRSTVGALRCSVSTWCAKADRCVFRLLRHT